MDIKDDSFYSINETLKLVDWSKRSVQRYASKNNLRKIDGRYLFTGLEIKKMTKQRDNVATRRENLVENGATLREVKQENLKHQERVKKLIIEIQDLTEKLQEKDKLIEEVKAENDDLKNNLKKHPNLTHREQLEKAIELITIEAVKKGLNHRVFTDSEYDEMVGTLAQVDSQEEQINYLRKRVEKQDEVLNKLANTVAEQLAEKRERNFIEAKEKGLDN